MKEKMKIYLWGTGVMASELMGKYIKDESIIGYVDNNQNKKVWRDKRVIAPIELKQLDYDAIIIASFYAQDIYRQCQKLNLNLNKIILTSSNVKITDYNKNYDFVNKILGADLAKTIKSQYSLLKKPVGWIDNNPLTQENNAVNRDIVRIKTLEMVAKEIKKRNIHGAVAELGVFRGEFARLINQIFSASNCYLCDTFEGFNPIEVNKEVRLGRTNVDFVNAFEDTDENIVVNKMPFKEKVILCKGIFPETMKSIDARFTFVSIDVDFEESIYQGLKYFYPRLCHGGYIFVHDYNNNNLAGVERAVDRFERKQNDLLNRVPIFDQCGTLVITK